MIMAVTPPFQMQPFYATPAFDRATCEQHGLPLVTFDGHRDAILPETDAQGRRFAEYGKRHGELPDVPRRRHTSCSSIRR